MRSGRPARVSADVSINFSCLRVSVRCSRGLVTGRSGSGSRQVAVGAEPGLEGAFEDLLHLVGLDALQLPLQGGPLEGSGEVGAEARRERDAADLGGGLDGGRP